MKRNCKQLGLVLLITGLDFLFGPLLLFMLKNSGFPTYAADHASEYLGKIILQTLLLSLYSIALFVVFRIRLKKNFWEAFSLRVRGKNQWIWVGGLLVMLTIMAGVGIQRTADPVLILFNLVYYVAFIGFTEEFLVRGACVYLLRELPWMVRYLVPNFLFAMLHILAYSHFAPMTPAYILRFMVSEVPGLMACGCCFQLLKDWTGTLWVPILFHGMLNFSNVFLF